MWKVLWDISLALCYIQTGIDAADRVIHGGKPLGFNDKVPGWNPIAHRDIKPANIFLTSRCSSDQFPVYPTVVLGDFGCSVTQRDQTSIRMSAFTRAFQPPEAPNFSETCDTYSLALSIHCMSQLTRHPWHDGEVVRQSPLAGAGCSSILSSVLQSCLKYRWIDRPDITELPFLTYRESQRAKIENAQRPQTTQPLPSWANAHPCVARHLVWRDK